MTPIIPANLGRFVHQPESQEQVAEDVWTLAKEIAVQADMAKNAAERCAVWLEDALATVSAVAVEEMTDNPGPATTVVPFLSSIGVVDGYLSDTHTIPNSSSSSTPPSTLTVNSPRLGVVFHTAVGGGAFGFHLFTWKGELFTTFSFPEASMGSAESARKAYEDGARTRNGDGRAVVVEFVEEFFGILGKVASTASSA